MNRRGGFTIIELMLVIGIIGILSTIAIPTMLGFKLRAKVAEGKTNLAAIHKAQEAYFAEFGIYVSATPVPASVSGAQARPWGLSSSDTTHGFNRIGFAPEGNVYFQYGAVSNGGTALTLAARSDLDGNGEFSTWGYVKPQSGAGAGVAGPFGVCPASGVYDQVSRAPNQLKKFGPCDADSGAGTF